ncbi:uncharacterized protein LOC132786775 [Drosophila nasuta]|uniref:uncharacterized protein LOC132786775 n=1 Tax=Drosophila nasuta TaxID=42062 RepID=UPI00295E9B90|nr:uncharacterized protein LOC132786775 [Drosophila nasuta]
MLHFGERCKFYEVQIGDKYAIYEADKNQFLVSIGNSPIMREERIELKENNFINADSKKIIEDVYAMTCLPYRFRFTEEIVKECTRRNKVHARHTILNYPRYEEMVERLMEQHFRLSRRNCSNFFNGTNYWPLIIVAFLLLFVMFFYRTRL